MLFKLMVWISECWVQTVGVPMAMLAVRRVQSKQSAVDGISMLIAVPTSFMDEVAYDPDATGMDTEDAVAQIGFNARKGSE